MARLGASKGWKGWWSRRLPWVHTKLFRPVHDAAFDFDDGSAGVRRLWSKLVGSLFREYYGLDLDLGQEELNALYLVSRSVPMTTYSDHLLMIVSQALGWSGLAATRLAPSLINRNYIAFNLFLIAIGVLYQWRVILGLNDEQLFGLLRVRALLRELRKGKKQAEPSKPDRPASELGL